MEEGEIEDRPEQALLGLSPSPVRYEGFTKFKPVDARMIWFIIRGRQKYKNKKKPTTPPGDSARRRLLSVVYSCVIV